MMFVKWVVVITDQ